MHVGIAGTPKSSAKTQPNAVASAKAETHTAVTFPEVEAHAAVTTTGSAALLRSRRLPEPRLPTQRNRSYVRQKQSVPHAALLREPGERSRKIVFRDKLARGFGPSTPATFALLEKMSSTGAPS
jgi:hypothetical protein